MKNNLFKYIHVFGKLKGSLIFYQIKSKKEIIHLKHWSFKNIYLRQKSSDIKCFEEIFLRKEYDLYYSINPKVIIDCGANIGLSAVFFKNKYPNTKIIAIEPDKSNFNLLQKNTHDHSDIICLNAAIWNKNTNLIIENPTADKWGFIVKETSTDSELKTITIDDIINEYGIDEIDILKIDIEGTELEVFSKNFENWLPKVKIILIELHDWFRMGCSKSFFSAIVNYDFLVFSKGENIICLRSDLKALI